MLWSDSSLFPPCRGRTGGYSYSAPCSIHNFGKHQRIWWSNWRSSFLPRWRAVIQVWPWDDLIISSFSRAFFEKYGSGALYRVDRDQHRSGQSAQDTGARRQADGLLRAVWRRKIRGGIRLLQSPRTVEKVIESIADIWMPPIITTKIYTLFGWLCKKLLTMVFCYAIVWNNLIHQTVEAEITAMMPVQRTRIAESRVRNKSSNGPLRAQSNVAFCHRVCCDVAGRRHLPGICWYPAKRTGHAVKSRWHRG